MTTLIRMVAVVALLAILLWVVSPHRQQTPRPLTDLRVAEAWLQCIDCQGPFLQRIRDTDPANLDTVTRFLRAALLSGPDSARAARLDRDLLRTWVADSLYRMRKGLPPATPQSEFLRRYRRGFEVMWRGRAATALGVVRNPLALAALDSATHLLAQFDSAHQVPDDGAISTIRLMVDRARADTGRSAAAPSP